ncbi:hypothetical protein SDC9_202681 [bioreactor metagenome]|uniref:Uncharacterized protein n=1 Tax=bioreactor metagenome TaxID=1076179 RepID=A0A645IVW6_9ZZZZ
MGREPLRRGGLIDRQKLNRDAQQILDFLKADIDPAAKVETLGVAHQQLVVASFDPAPVGQPCAESRQHQRGRRRPLGADPAQPADAGHPRALAPRKGHQRDAGGRGEQPAAVHGEAGGAAVCGRHGGSPR